jgi:DNA repair exonuclease SbcCD ATPase subunit
MLRTIYGDEYRFGLQFEIKRNKSECKVLVFKNDIELNVKEDETGGGVIDIVSFAMRLAVWSLTRPRTEPLFVLDEPFKFVKGAGKLEMVGQVLQELSKSLGVQIIMASHDDALIEASDTAYRVIIDNDISEVRREK